MTHYWRLRRWLPERHGHPCRIFARGVGPGPRNIGVEFADGYRVVTARWSVRRRDGREAFRLAGMEWVEPEDRT